MLRKLATWAAIGLALVLLQEPGCSRPAFASSWYGGGVPRLRFVESERTRTERIARDRSAHQSPRPAPESDVPVQSPVAAVRPVETAGTPMPPRQASGPVARAASEYWTDFRGPQRDGHYRERPILTRWPADGLKPLWKQPVGAGYASFVIARGRAFTIEQRGPQEVVAAYDVATGRELWTTTWTAAFHEMMGGDGPRATPSWADGRVYALGAMGELRALEEATGRTVWRTNILADAGARTSSGAWRPPH